MSVFYYSLIFLSVFSFRLGAADANSIEDFFGFPESEDFDIDQFLNFPDDPIEQSNNIISDPSIQEFTVEIEEDKRIIETDNLHLDATHPEKQPVFAVALPANFIFVCQGHIEIPDVSYECLSISPRLRSQADRLIEADNLDTNAKISVEGIEPEVMIIVLKYMKIELELTHQSLGEDDVIEKLAHYLSNDNYVSGKTFYYVLNSANFLKCNLLYKALKQIEAQRMAPRVAFALEAEPELSSPPLSLDSADTVKPQKKDVCKGSPKKKISKSKSSDDDLEEESRPKKKPRKKQKISKPKDSDDDSEEEAPLKPRKKKGNHGSANSELLGCKYSGCEYIAKSRKNLKEHHKFEHTECPHADCHFSGPKKWLSKHYRDKHPESTFVSEGSKKVSKNNASNVQFKRTKERRFVCKYFGCIYTTDKKSHFDRHQRNKHILCPHAGCDYCLQKKELSKHCKEIHKTGHFICSHPGCEFITDHKRTFQDHKKQIHYDCLISGCEFSSSLNYFEIHKKTAHPKSKD